MNKQKYRGAGGVYAPKNNTPGNDLRAVFNSITYDVDEMLSRIKFTTVVRPTPSNSGQSFNIDFDGPNITEHIHITTKYWRTYGRCYSIQPKDHVIELGIIRLEIVAHLNIYIYFGHPGQFMHTGTVSKVSKRLVILCGILQLTIKRSILN